MKKRFNKIICVSVAAISALGITVAAGCGKYYSQKALGGDYLSGTVISNGGFAVEKGNYVYFINGVESNTAENEFGKPQKGAIYRISSANLSAHNYAGAECVVPLVAYTADYNAGIFIYGNYIYYATPSTAKNSETETLNDNLEFKRTKLNGTETVKDSFIQFPSLSYEYRFVEENGKVYLLYVETDSSDGDVKNIRSLNVETGENTLLAYNVDSVVFDAENKSNPRVYYTMSVKNYATDKPYAYNQVYTVTASTTKANEYDFSSIVGWNDDESKGTVDKYVNCGTLVFDGIGMTDDTTPFNYNYGKENAAEINRAGYTYSLVKYQDDALIYTRKTDINTSENLFVQASAAYPEIWNAVETNPANDETLLTGATSAANYKYIFEEGALKQVILADSDGIKVNKVVDGKLQKTVDNKNFYFIKQDVSATLLFTEDNYLYYSATGGNGYTFNRIDYTAQDPKVYIRMPETTAVDDYKGVRILDLDACSDWYMPEIRKGQLMFASEIDGDVYESNYIYTFDLRKDRTDGTVMTNAEIYALNKRYDGIDEIIDKYSDTDKYDTKNYANVHDAVKYAFFTGDDAYLKDLAAACNAKLEDDADLVYSDKTLAEVAAFLAPAEGNLWKDYTDTAKVNGEDVYSNRRDFYYGLMGEQTQADKESYESSLKTTYLKAWPEDDTSWYEGLSDGAKAGFIIGMCAAGMVVIGGVTVLALWLARRKNNKNATVSRRRIKVDTTDDKDIDVYSDGETDGTKDGE